MTYAEKTTVPVDRSRAEIEGILKKYGAKQFAYFSEQQRAVIVFVAAERRIRFDLPLPDEAADKKGQVARQRWRALLLCIKAKLESVATKIETFEEAFLAHVVLPDGRTVMEHVQPRIETTYRTGAIQALLPAPRLPSEHEDEDRP